MGAREQERLDEFVLTTALIMRMFIFILLGAQVDFALMSRYLVGGALVVAIFMLVARPITVFLCAAPDRRAPWAFNEMLFICSTRATRVIPPAPPRPPVSMYAPRPPRLPPPTLLAGLTTLPPPASTSPLPA